MKYEDKLGNKFVENSILIGNVGEEYSLSEKEILGYILIEILINV